MYPDAKLPDHVLGVRIDGEFYYANAQPTVDEIIATIKKHKDATDLLLDMTAVFELDYTCAHELKRIETQCEKSNVELHLVRVHSAIADDLKKVDLDSFVISRDDAIPERLVGKRAEPNDSGPDIHDKRSASSSGGKSGDGGS
jgi:MFS superfamily sulfate permease-like transporter